MSALPGSVQGAVHASFLRTALDVVRANSRFVAVPQSADQALQRDCERGHGRKATAVSSASQQSLATPLSALMGAGKRKARKVAL